MYSNQPISNTMYNFGVQQEQPYYTLALGPQAAYEAYNNALIADGYKEPPIVYSYQQPVIYQEQQQVTHSQPIAQEVVTTTYKNPFGKSSEVCCENNTTSVKVNNEAAVSAQYYNPYMGQQQQAYNQQMMMQQMPVNNMSTNPYMQYEGYDEVPVYIRAIDEQRERFLRDAQENGTLTAIQEQALNMRQQSMAQYPPANNVVGAQYNHQQMYNQQMMMQQQMAQQQIMQQQMYQQQMPVNMYQQQPQYIQNGYNMYPQESQMDRIRRMYPDMLWKHLGKTPEQQQLIARQERALQAQNEAYQQQQQMYQQQMAQQAQQQMMQQQQMQQNISQQQVMQDPENIQTANNNTGYKDYKMGYLKQPSTIPAQSAEESDPFDSMDGMVDANAGGYKDYNQQPIQQQPIVEEEPEPEDKFTLHVKEMIRQRDEALKAQGIDLITDDPNIPTEINGKKLSIYQQQEYIKIKNKLDQNQGKKEDDIPFGLDLTGIEVVDDEPEVEEEIIHINNDGYNSAPTQQQQVEQQPVVQPQQNTPQQAPNPDDILLPIAENAGCYKDQYNQQQAMQQQMYQQQMAQQQQMMQQNIPQEQMIQQQMYQQQMAQQQQMMQQNIPQEQMIQQQMYQQQQMMQNPAAQPRYNQIFYSANGLPYSFNLPPGAPPPEGFTAEPPNNRRPVNPINPINSSFEIPNPRTPFYNNPFVSPYNYSNAYYNSGLGPYNDPDAYKAFMAEQEKLAREQREFEASLMKKSLKNYYASHNIEFTEEIERRIDERNEAFINPPPPPEKEQYEIDQEMLDAWLPYAVPCTMEDPDPYILNARINMLNIHNHMKKLNPDDIGVVEFFNDYAGRIITEEGLIEARIYQTTKLAEFNRDHYKERLRGIGMTLEEFKQFMKEKIESGDNNIVEAFEDGKPIEIKDGKPMFSLNGRNNGMWFYTTDEESYDENGNPITLMRNRVDRVASFFKKVKTGAAERNAKVRAKGIEV